MSSNHLQIRSRPPLRWAARAVLLTVVTATVPGCRSAEVRGASAPEHQTTAVPATAAEIPQHTVVKVRLNQAIGTEISQVGDRFTAVVSDEVVAANGEVAIPRGSTVTGVVTEVQPSKHVGQTAAIRLEFETIALENDRYPLKAEVIQADVEQERSARAPVVGAAAGAAGGALLGAILGGGSGALKGGLAGAAAGTVIGLGTGDVEAKLPVGTELTLRTTRTIQVGV